jgi:hypothetical protein
MLGETSLSYITRSGKKGTLCPFLWGAIFHICRICTSAPLFLTMYYSLRIRGQTVPQILSTRLVCRIITVSLYLLTQHTMLAAQQMPGNVCHGLYRHLWPSDVRSSTMRRFTTLWEMPEMLRLSYFALGGQFCPFFYQWVLKKNFANQGQHPPWPLLPPVAVCCLFWHSAPACHIMGNVRHAWFVVFCTWGWFLSIFWSVHFKVIFRQSGVTSITASTAACGSILPVTAQCACLPHHGQHQACSVCFILPWGLLGAPKCHQEI